MNQKLEGGTRLQGIKKQSLPNKPFISIITVVLNNVQTLEETILSVLRQTYRNFEYIIVDGGSTDGTLEIIKKYNNQIDYWISEPDKGIYNAMNKGIKNSRGDWIHILNSDDFYFSNNCLEKAVSVLSESAEKFYYFTLILQDYKGGLRFHKYPFNFLNYLKLYYSAYLPHPTLFAARKHYETVGLFDETFSIAADHDLILRLCRRFKPVFQDLPLVVMRQGGLSSKNIPKTFREFKVVTIKNGLPSWLAQLIFWFKIFKHKIRRNVNYEE